MTVEIVAGTVQLRPWHVDDAVELLPAMEDPQIQLWNGGVARNGRTLESARGWVETRTASDGSAHGWAIRDVVGGALLGQVSLFSIDHDQGGAEMGYWLLPEARGRGAGTIAVRAATGYAFEGLGLRRVELFHAIENTASCRLAERAGFLLEGTHRQSHRFGDGHWHDEHTHGRLATDPYPED